jgi:hypothetical protein
MLLSEFKLDIGLCYLTPFIGTAIRETPEKFNLDLLYEDFEFKKLCFGEPLCRAKEMNITELDNLYVYSDLELQRFLINNMFKLSKEKIDKKILYDRENFRNNINLSSISWSRTFNRLFQLQRYYIFYEQGIVIKQFNEIGLSEIINLCPLRLWDINYDLEKNEYSFSSFSGEKITITEVDLYLWEMASGKNSIKEIVKNMPSILNEKDNIIEYSYNFYRKMENNFALIFKVV